MNDEVRRAGVHVTGIVQGVGFRPHVFNLAARLGLAGWVRNDARGLTAEVEGDAGAVERFLAEISESPPPLAVVESVRVTELPPSGASGFRILASEPGERRVHVSPDVATCGDCLREVLDPRDRRHRYPFTNCTNCGPRYTIVEDVPYDRARTTMSAFPMCPACAAEYSDPSNRRFHAQPNACPACGPRVHLLGAREVAQGGTAARERGGDPPWMLPGAAPPGDEISRAARLLASGEILAVKGLGGYHLACDAADEAAVARLRGRKHREDRPFALMAPDLEAARALCETSPEEEALLLSRRRPIVLLRKRPGARVAPSVAPRYDTLGIMLPYTPLHHLLLAEARRTLVMTSGNLSDEPIAFEDAEARARLSGIADAFLVHDRAIHIRCDDSVTRIIAGAESPIRRSRGWAPEPVRMPLHAPLPLLATGAQLKSAVAAVRDDLCFLSHHIGDLENLETLRSFEQAAEHLARLFDVPYGAVAHDLHPEYLSTKWAEARSDLVRVPVQHHHAHIASCMAENLRTDPVLGVAFDGLGYGSDGTLWGGEFLVASLAGFKRVGHLATAPMPGGEQAIRQPWRMAAVWLERAFGEDHVRLPLDLPAEVGATRWRNCLRMAARGVNSPATSSMGRLFDAVAALAGVRAEVTYEGQAAIELEALAAREGGAPYPFGVAEGPDGTLLVDPVPCVRAVVADVLEGFEAPTISARFHAGVAAMVAEVLERLRRATGIGTVALSGGVFQNALLTGTVTPLLEGGGFEVLRHRRVPANDGGIALGQAAVAAAVLAGGGPPGYTDPGKVDAAKGGSTDVPWRSR
ncbi:MAG: carbamoyltransferase HypF [Acidobacteria bacterium]|nr:carbamoyltransferase HypF [Acidobacteriota bacterium]